MGLFRVPSPSVSTQPSTSISDFQSVISTNLYQEELVMSDKLPDAHNPQSSIPQQTPTAPLLTPEQIAQILAALQFQEKPVNIKRAAPLREEKAQPSKWPEWDGKSVH